ncbi:MAG: PHP domain-containing protein [Chloroflexota bacterium]
MDTRGPFDVDLQAHTTASDGTCSPSQVVELAAARGLRALAITDHDSVLGVHEALAAGARLGVEMAPAIELSTRDEPDKDFMELHLLGYFVDPDDAALNETLVRVIQGRVAQKRQQIQRLQQLGFDVPEEEVFALADGVPGRPHIVEVLLRRNPRCPLSRQQLFDEYLSVGGEAYVPRPFELSLEEAIRLVRSAGGVPVLAHPAAYPKVADPVGVVRRAVPLGLRGIEINYPYHKNRPHFGISGAGLQALIARFDALADELGLLKTGGSDFHGHRKPIELGEMGLVYRDYLRFKEACGR